jgi:hypothetical protein
MSSGDFATICFGIAMVITAYSLILYAKKWRG